MHDERLWVRLLLCLFCFWGQLAHATNVTFQVDLNQVGVVHPAGVHLLGSMNMWNPSSDSMSNQGNGQFALTKTFPAGTLLEYNFVNGNAWGEEEILLGKCALGGHRYLQVPATDTVLPPVCFGYCDINCSVPMGKRIACIGNSITDGWGTSNRVLKSPPAVLQDSLGGNYLVSSFAAPGLAMFRNAGNSYWDSPQWRYVQAFDAAEAFVMLGTNDSKGLLWGSYAQQFYPDYDSLLDILSASSPGLEPTLVLPPKAFSNAFGILDAVIATQINPAILRLARARGLPVLDMYTRTAGRAADFPDGVHPNDAGSALIAQALQMAILRPAFAIQQAGNQLRAPAAYAYQWYRDGDTISAAQGGQHRTYTALQPGSYRVATQPDSTLRDWFLSDSLLHLPVGLPTASLANELTIFPNPPQDFAHIKFANPLQEIAKITCWDERGMQVTRHETRAENFQLPVAAWLPGLYWIKVEVGRKIAWGRLQVVR